MAEGLVSGRQVRGVDDGVIPRRPFMARYAPAAVQNLDHSGGHSDIDLLTHELERRAEHATAHVDHLVHAHPCPPELHVLVSVCRHGPQRRPVQGFEGARSASGQFLEDPIVQVGQQLPDGVVQFAKTREDPLSEGPSSFSVERNIQNPHW